MYQFDLNNMYKNKKDGRVIYLLARSSGFYDIATIQLKKFSLDNSLERMEPIYFIKNYEVIDFVTPELDAAINYFEKIIEMKNLQDALLQLEEEVEDLIGNSNDDLENLESHNKENRKVRNYFLDDTVLHEKHALASYLGVSTSNLEVYIKKNHFDHYFLTKEEVMKIAKDIEYSQSKKNVYKYGDIKSGSITMFLYRVGIGETFFQKWRIENNIKLDDLNNEEVMGSLIDAYKSYKKSKSKK